MSAIVSIGEWIAQRRRFLDLTQRELAERTNCALATIKKIEIDERRPSRELAQSVAEVLRIPADQMTVFVDCARGLRAVDVLDSIRTTRETVRESSPAPTISIPLSATPFIGREQELQQIGSYLRDPACRLLTLVGPGGIGKTRLAYEAAAASAQNFLSGVFVVPLAGVSASDFLLSAIAERLKVSFFSSEDHKAQVFSFLRSKTVLLVLDNLEHLLDGIGLLADILSATPGVKILATSRERLNLSGEWLFPVTGLPYPTDTDQGDKEGFNAVRLFEGCARRVLPNFRLSENLTAAVRVCQLVEGMPLAIELAASWVRRMPCDQIAEEVQRDLDFLAAGWRDVPERHRSIRALFEHSWRLLSPDEQTVLMKLSVFRGGFDSEAAQQVAGASRVILTSLEDKSLVQGNLSGRCDLHELVRQYAESRLTQAGQGTEIRNRHLDYFMTWAEVASDELHGPEQVVWGRRIKLEYGNVRAALGWAFGGGDAEKGLRLANGLWYYWFRGDANWDEGFQWFELGLEQTEGITPIRSMAFTQAGALAAQISKFPTAMNYMQRGYAYAQQLKEAHGIARYIMGMSYVMSDYAEVSAKFEQAIALLRKDGTQWELSTALMLYGDRARVQGDLQRAQELYDESSALTQGGQDLMMIMANLGRQARLSALKGDYRKAMGYNMEGSAWARQLDSRIALAEYLIHHSILAVYLGDYESAEHSLQESLAISEDLSNRGGIIHAKYYGAELALHRGKFTETATLLVESLTLTLDNPNWRDNFTNQEFNTERLIIAGKLACALGDFPNAAWLLSAGEAVRAQSGYLLDSLPRGEYERAVQKTREQPGDEFEQAWQNGVILTEEEAVRRAIDYLERTIAKRQQA